MEMTQLEVLKTKTRGFNEVNEALEYIATSEKDGWAVRQIAILAQSGDYAIFVVLEDNR